VPRNRGWHRHARSQAWIDTGSQRVRTGALHRWHGWSPVMTRELEGRTYGVASSKPPRHHQFLFLNTVPVAAPSRWRCRVGAAVAVRSSSLAPRADKPRTSPQPAGRTSRQLALRSRTEIRAKLVAQNRLGSTQTRYKTSRVEFYFLLLNEFKLNLFNSFNTVKYM
jgi:hypothetical protein